MMNNLEEKKVRRLKFFRAVYDATGGSENHLVDMWEIGRQLDLTTDETSSIAQYLVGEGLLTFQAIGGIIGLTHTGIKEYESAVSSPNSETTHFPPINIINIEHMDHSQIQQDSHGSTQTLSSTTSDDLFELARAVSSNLSDKLSELGLSSEHRQDLEGQIITTQAQLKVSKPNRTIIQEGLRSIRDILQSVSSNVIASDILKKLKGI